MTTAYNNVYKTNSDVPYTDLTGLELQKKDVVVFEGEDLFHKVTEVTDNLEYGSKTFEGLVGTLNVSFMQKVFQLVSEDEEELPKSHFTYFYEGLEVKTSTKLGKNQVISFRKDGELYLAKVLNIVKKEVKGELDLELELLPFTVVPSLYSVTTKESHEKGAKYTVELFTTYKEALGVVVDKRCNKQLAHL